MRANYYCDNSNKTDISDKFNEYIIDIMTIIHNNLNSMEMHNKFELNVYKKDIKPYGSRISVLLQTFNYLYSEFVINRKLEIDLKPFSKDIERSEEHTSELQSH